MSTYTDVLKSAQQLTPAEREQLRQDLEVGSDREQRVPATPLADTQSDPMLTFIGSIDEEPAMTGDLDSAIYG